MANQVRKITLTELNGIAGPNFSVQYSTDCITYSQSVDCTNAFLPSVGSVVYCTVDSDSTCIRLTSLSEACGNTVIENVNPITTTTTSTTTAAPTTTTTTLEPTTTTTSTTTTTAAPTTTTTTLEPTTTTTTSTTTTTTTTTTAAPTTTTTSTTSTTTTTLQPVWYSLYNCVDGSTQYSTQKTAGTFVVNERVTFGGAFWYVIAELTSNPGGSLIDVVSVGGSGVTGCPTTTTTTTTTTAAPLLVSNGSITCIGNLGTFTSTFSGGSGTYSYTAIADSQANASNAVQGISGTRYAVTGNTYEWASIANGTYYVAVLDSVGTVSVQNTPVVINCTTTTTTTTTAAPAYCYTLETVQSSQGECFDCPGYFASTTDTVMKIFTACSGSEIFPPFDINVESRYSDNSTSSLFIPSGYTSSIIIATSDVQCVAAPTCGEIASPTFVSASIVPVSGTIVECCV